MHVLFVHQNYPAQFGHIAWRLISDLGWQCTFVSRLPPRNDRGVKLVQYELAGEATINNHYCARTFENAIWNAHAVYQACEQKLKTAPDLIVGHSGFGSTLFLRELFQCPIINYFEYYYHTKNSDLDFRPDFQPTTLDYLHTRARNSILLLDLNNCDAGYCPTNWQRSRFPTEYLPKLEVIFDGVDTRLWYRRKRRERRIGGRLLKKKARVITYCSWGLEAMRGFDIFMKVARRIYEEYPDSLFVVVGADQTYYGGDERYIKHATFKEHVLSQDDYDLSRFCFTGQIPTKQLVEILSLSDLHIYLSVPFVLSWSVFNALACECIVLASDTAPVRELISHGENGLLVDFHDVEGLASNALKVLRDPAMYRSMGTRGAELIREKYNLDSSLERLTSFYRQVCTETKSAVTP